MNEIVGLRTLRHRRLWGSVGTLLSSAVMTATLAPGTSAQLEEPTVGAGATATLDTTDPSDRFQLGNSLYQSGDFEAALAAYLQILEAGLESGDLYYNIGNAHFKLGHLGPAILFYERAARILPRDPTVRANLELARSLTADQITPLPGFWVADVIRWWVDLVPRGWLIALVALGYLGVATMIVVRVLSARAPTWTMGGAVTAGVVTVLLGINLLVRDLDLGRAERGVVLEVEAAVQSAPSDDPSLQLFTIHEGSVVRIDRRTDEWLEVVLEDGKVGWIRSETLESI